MWVLSRRATPSIVLLTNSIDSEISLMRQSRFALAPQTLAMLVMVGATGHVLAQTDPVAPTPVSINAQPLGQALNELARQTHL